MVIGGAGRYLPKNRSAITVDVVKRCYPVLIRDERTHIGVTYEQIVKMIHLGYPIYEHDDTDMTVVLMLKSKKDGHWYEVAAWNRAWAV